MLTEVTLRAPEGRAEALSDALLECGALCVSIEDARADASGECALYGEPGLPAAAAWSESRLRVMASSEEVDAVVAAAAAATQLTLLI